VAEKTAEFQLSVESFLVSIVMFLFQQQKAVACSSHYTSLGEKRKKKTTYVKCSKIELVINTHQTTCLLFPILLTFLKLLIPMSNQSPLLCASSISRLVGAAKTCAQ
jgi:hypothetical protein